MGTLPLSLPLAARERSKQQRRQEGRKEGADGCVRVRPRVPVFSFPPANDLIYYGKGLDIES